MNSPFRLSNWFVVPGITLLIGAVASAVAFSQTEGVPPVPPESAAVEEVAPGNAAQEDEVEVLTRGPLHEAFATPVDQDPEPSPPVEAKPPEPVAELPPDVKPDGNNVEWIPGYWAWDEEAERYIWISGVWRAVPPGREWVPGYWSEDAGGHRWVSGYWGATAPSGTQVAESVYRAAEEAQNYVAPPPETLDVGPASPQPSDQHFWIPGCWIYADAGYRWRPGYWYEYQPNWVWVPDHYTWTPAGCLFVNGYWDYTLQSRGMVFAPVYFTQPIYTRPYYHYRPRYALELAHLALHLFVHPRYHYYHYGDYYGPHYASFGYRPWFHLHFGHHHHHRHRRHYDPLLAYYGAHYHRHGIDYFGRLRGWHRYYDDHEHHRPPRTVAKARDVVRHAREQSAHRHVLARSVDHVRLERRDGGRRIVDLDSNEATQERLRRQVDAARDVARARRTMERGAGGPRDVVDQDRPSRREVVRMGPKAIDRAQNSINEASREEFRRALQQSRELARAGREDNPSRTRGPNRGEDGERRVIVRGQQPQRTFAQDRSRDNSGESRRERVMRLDPSERTQGPDVQAARRQAQESQRPDVQAAPRRQAQESLRTYQQRWRFGQDAGPQGRSSNDAARVQQARDAARQAQDAAIARQRSVDAARDVQRFRSSGPRDVTGPSARSGGGSTPSIVGRSELRSSPPRQQIERSQRPTQRMQRAAPQPAPRSIDRARSFARERAAAPRPSVQQRSAPQRSPAAVRSAPQRSPAAARSAPQRSPAAARAPARSRSVQPSFKANQFRSGRGSSPAATMRRGPSARSQRAAPSGGGKGGSSRRGRGKGK